MAPAAAFDFAPGAPEAGEEVAFSDQSTDPDGTVVAWSWDFGDGAASTAQNPTHTYASGGFYDVTLTVTDDDGAQATTTQEVWVCEDALILPDPTDPMSLLHGHIEQCLDLGGGWPWPGQ